MKKTRDTARLFYCARCHQPVVICSRCDRGNIYCGSICSAHARVLNHRIANQKYQHSLKGRLKHAQRQQHYRERKKATAKKVTDQGSPVLLPDDVLRGKPNERPSWQASAAHCHFCSQPVSLFLRNGFLRHHMNDVLSSWPLGP
jgi:hypothetical protein